MLIYQDNTYLLKFDQDLNTLFAIWHDIESLTDDRYKVLLMHYIGAVKEFNPENILIDTREGYYPLDEELQKWTDETICQEIEKTGTRKIAFVVPQIAVLSAPLENMAARLNSISKIERKVFYSYTKAVDWLINEPLLVK